MEAIDRYIKPIFRPLYNPVFDAWYRFRVDYFTKSVLEEKWLAFAGKPIDWEKTQTLNEKIQWLIAFSDTSEWTRLADKVLVRDYVKEKGLEDILIPMIGTWKDARDIDFDALPDKCVLKCNHDSGSVIIFDRSKGYDKREIVAELNNKLKIKYGYTGCEPHYNSIDPCILCEEFIDLDSDGLSTTPIDYKVFCYNGEPDVIWIAYNRSAHSVEHESRDLEWNHRPEWEADHRHYKKGHGIIPCPKSLQQMLEAARILSHGFPQVRVDFYDVKGKLYFGEMTFTSNGGTMSFFSNEYQRHAGALIDLSTAKRK